MTHYILNTMPSIYSSTNSWQDNRIPYIYVLSISTFFSFGLTGWCLDIISKSYFLIMMAQVPHEHP